LQDLFQSLLVARLPEPREQFVECEEQLFVAGLDGLDAQRDGQVRLARARRSEKDDIVAALDEREAGQVGQLDLAVSLGADVAALTDRVTRHAVAHAVDRAAVLD